MAGDSKAFDPVDRVILDTLIGSGRISWRELGEQVHLSSTSVAERVHRLERDGVITGYQAMVDPASLGRGLRAVVELSLRADIVPEDFERALGARAEVTFAAYVTGAMDYAVLVDCDGAQGLDAFTRWCKSSGASRSESRVVLRRVVG